MIIQGYRIHSTGLPEIEKALEPVRKKVDRIAFHSFRTLLGKEAAWICDQISLNQIQQVGSIYDAALESLMRKIQISSTTDLPDAYHFRLYLHVLMDEEYAYLNLLCRNPAFLAAFDGLEAFSLTGEESRDPHNAKTQKWIQLQKKYENCEPFLLNLSPDLDLILKRLKEKENPLIYPSVTERADVEARYAVENHYLTMIAGGGQIQPQDLMPFMDRALELATSEEGKQSIQERKLELMRILIDLSADDSVLYKKTNDPAESSDRSQKE